MVQMYRVFLNEKVVVIYQDINIPVLKPGQMLLEFTGNPTLDKVYRQFKNDKSIKEILIKTSGNFVETCKLFNAMFFKIEAAGGIVRNENDGFLFIKRLGIWDLPKGKLKKDETAEHGAIREVMEETGLNGLHITKKLQSTFHIYTNKKGREILKETFWFEMKCQSVQTLVPQTEEDITEVKWFKPEEINIISQKTYPSLRALLQVYLGQRL
jgi:ADP-ribose pyrophosphatase YjhB (NUDIX family)